jgi:acetylornithine deacetylase
MDNAAIRAAIAALLPEAQAFLCELLRFPSTPGQEHEAMIWLDQRFRQAGIAVERAPMDNSLKQDPDYSTPVPDLDYAGRFNLRARYPGRGGGKTILFNVHTDVVPPSEGQPSPWEPRLEGDTIFARGACDDKGPLTALFLVFRTLQTLRADLPGDVLAHLVCEEENGGNGSLAMVRGGEQADGCVVLEPTARQLFTSIRGAVWFRLVLHGRAGHSGQAGRTRSALLMARDAMAILETYHDELLAASRGLPLFDPYPNPMPITFGKLQAGNWPAAAPSRAVLEGVLGLLPNKTKEHVCAEMRQALLAGGRFAESDFELSFMYRHDSSVVDPSHELPQGLLRAAKSVDVALTIAAMTASCDAWFYANQLGIPAVVYGPGTLAVAHSKDEQIAMADIAEAAAVLTRFVLDACGGPPCRAEETDA